MKNSIAIIIFIFISQVAFSQALNNSFFTEADQFFKKHITNGEVDYAQAKTSAGLKALITKVGKTDLSNASAAERKAFYINAYNLIVINTAAQSYPIASVNDIPGFFDRQKHQVAGESLTLNKLEKERLLKTTNDARLHFVLVCGAVDCPPIVNFAYTPAKLDQQMETQTRLAVNNPDFIKVNGNEVALSNIFKWYVGDFGGNQKSVIEFINKYRSNAITPANKISYYEYNWQINDRSTGQSSVGDLGANQSRYVVSAAIPKGSVELKLFNNLYTQQTGSVENLTDRATFFTTTLSALYGVNNRFNAGLEARYRRVDYAGLPNSPFAVFNGTTEGQNRSGLTGIGPKVRIAPFPQLKNFSIQSTLLFGTRNDLSGTDDLPYIDWSGPTFYTQFFNDLTIGSNFSLFTEIDLWIEDIGGQSHANRISTPATVIFSFFPNPKTTLYTLGSFSPFYQSEFDYFVQGGFGAKYQINSNFEVELLYTGFTNKFLLDTGGNARTYNIGIRYNL